MFKKIVKVFYGTDCLPYKDKELTVHYPITGNSFLGASNSTEIRFYIDKIGDIEDTWVANSKLPNGIPGNYLFQNADKGEDEDGNYLALQVSSFYTQAKGDVYISLNGFYGGVEIDDSGDVPVISGIPTIQATGCIKFSVYYATPLIDGEEVQQVTLAQVLAAIGTKLDKSSHRYLKIIDNINQINNDPNNAEFYFANDIVYDKTSKEFYSIGGTFPNLTSTAIRLYFGDLDVDNLFAENIQVSGDLEVEDFSHIVSFDGEESETLVEYLGRLLDPKANKTYVDSNFAHSIDLSIDSNYDLVVKLLDKNGTELARDDIDLPLESIVVSATYYDTYTYDGTTYSKVIVIVLATTDVPTIIPVGDLVNGLVNTSELTTALASYVPILRTIAGIDLAYDVTAQELTDALVFATDNDIENIMED